MSSGINILFQFPTQCVQTQIQHELKKKEKEKEKKKREVTKRLHRSCF